VMGEGCRRDEMGDKLDFRRKKVAETRRGAARCSTTMKVSSVNEDLNWLIEQSALMIAKGEMRYSPEELRRLDNSFTFHLICIYILCLKTSDVYQMRFLSMYERIMTLSRKFIYYIWLINIIFYLHIRRFFANCT